MNLKDFLETKRYIIVLHEDKDNPKHTFVKTPFDSEFYRTEKGAIRQACLAKYKHIVTKVYEVNLNGHYKLVWQHAGESLVLKT